MTAATIAEFRLLRAQEVRAASVLFDATGFASYTGGVSTEWSSTSGTPYTDIQDTILTLKQNMGGVFDGNLCLAVSEKVYRNMIQTTEIQGLIKGGNFDNSVVIIDRDLEDSELDHLKNMLGLKEEIKPSINGILNNVQLRFKNEPVRHKALDLIGDLALLGMPIQAHVMCARSGHKANVELVKKIKKMYEKKMIAKRFKTEQTDGYLLDIDDRKTGRQAPDCR